MESLAPRAGSVHSYSEIGSSWKGDSLPDQGVGQSSQCLVLWRTLVPWAWENAEQEGGSHSLSRLGCRWRLWAGCPHLSSFAGPRTLEKKGNGASFLAARDPSLGKGPHYPSLQISFLGCHQLLGLYGDKFTRFQVPWIVSSLIGCLNYKISDL